MSLLTSFFGYDPITCDHCHVKPIINTYFFPFSLKYLFFVNHLLIKFTLLKQMIRNTMIIQLTFYSLNNESYAEDNIKVHLKAKINV